MIHHRGALYLVGWAPRHQRVQHWKVDRIEEVEVTGLQFQRPEGFDLRRHLAGSFGVFDGEGDVRVQIRFSPAAARYVEEGRWRASQRLTRQSDGSLLAKFHLSAAEEIKRWVLGFGKEAEVLEPEGLRQEMAQELRTLLSQYRASEEPRARRTRIRD